MRIRYKTLLSLTLVAVFATLAVRKGTLEVLLNDKVFTLRRGEAVSFDCVFPHKYTAIEDVEFVVVSHSRR